MEDDNIMLRISKIHQDLREEQQHNYPLSDLYERSSPEDGRNNPNHAYYDDTTIMQREVQEHNSIRAIIPYQTPKTFATAICCEENDSDAAQISPNQDISIMIQERSKFLELTTKEGRFKMEELLMVQKKTGEATQKARQHLARAKLNLEQCETRGAVVDQKVINAAESSASILLQVESPWNEMYQDLLKYKEAHGGCNVKHALLPYQGSSNPGYIDLGCWVKKIRQQVERSPDEPGWLEPYQIIALNRVGFEWKPQENAWIENYLMLKAYMDEHGKGRNPPNRRNSLGAWCFQQRATYKRLQIGIKNCMNKEEILLLNEIGFIWDHHSNRWMEGYVKLQKFYRKNNHCRISKQCGDMVLFRWVVNERRKYRNFIKRKRPTQTKAQWDLLNSIGFFDGFHVNPWMEYRK